MEVTFEIKGLDLTGAVILIAVAEVLINQYKVLTGTDVEALKNIGEAAEATKEKVISIYGIDAYTNEYIEQTLNVQNYL